MSSRSVCPFCRPYPLADAPLRFTCPECGSAMLRLEVPGADHTYHCPLHCSTLVPSVPMIVAAQAEAN